MQTYRNSSLGFSISYPSSWEAVPAPWMKQFMSRAKGTSEKLAEYIAQGSQPFLIAQNPNVPPGVAIPAVKCQAYNPASIAAAGGIDGVLSSMIRYSQQAYPDFEVNEFTPECVMAGVVGTKMTVSMTVLNPEGNSFHGKTEMHFLPTPSFVFLVALTATSDPSLRPTEELLQIVRSIRLGRRA